MLFSRKAKKIIALTLVVLMLGSILAAAVIPFLQ
jgi:hypothetical protein